MSIWSVSFRLVVAGLLAVGVAACSTDEDFDFGGGGCCRALKIDQDFEVLLTEN
jgi:hypothetical protein